MKKIYLLLAILLSSSYCNETLPPLDVPEDPVLGLVRLNSIRIGVADSTGTPNSPMNLSVGVINDFDETLQNTRSIKVELNIWVQSTPAVRNTLYLSETETEELLTLDPGEEFWIDIEWDHRDENNTFLWNSINPPLTITKHGASVEICSEGHIQVFRNLKPVHIQESCFSLEYFIEEKGDTLVAP
ncbi:MAG: hypothetical protein V2J62_13075 [candidate division KSB1 bacterium]|jgi:hypothetical protein|nr:hypothetical protein [candidate division KSB1 bacterium]